MPGPAIAIGHKNQVLNGIAITVSILGGIAGIYFIVHQIGSLQLQKEKHDKEKQLLDLQIQKHKLELMGFDSAVSGPQTEPRKWS